MPALGRSLLVFAVFLIYGDCRFVIDARMMVRLELVRADICSQCSQVLQLSDNMISSTNTKESLYGTLHALCQHLPKEQAAECDSQVKMYLPKILQQTTGHLKADETCAVFGLCSAQNKEEPRIFPHHSNEELVPVLSTDTHINEQLNPACTLCLFVIKKLEKLLPKNMTEETLLKIINEVCDLMPRSYEDKCNDFINKYGQEIVEFLLSSAAPHTICTLLHLCVFTDPPAPDVLAPSDCESCRTLALLSRIHMGINSTQPETSTFLQSVCALHPNAIPKCDLFTQIYGPKLQEAFRDQGQRSDLCERADLCAAKNLEPLGRNPCAWGPSYWCQDIKTAQKCNNLAFCEKYLWKNNQ